MAYGGTSTLTGSKYGSLSENDAFSIQKKFLAIAKRNLVFARFAQKETKARNDGLEVRWRRYEKLGLPLIPLAEGIKPVADSIQQTTIKVKLHQYGSYIPTTDILEAVHTDPVIQQIVERQSIQAAELLDFLTYLHARTGTQVSYAGDVTAVGDALADSLNEVNRTVCMDGGVNNTTTGMDTQSTKLLDSAIRTLEYNEALKIAKQMTPSPDYGTEPVPEAYIAVCHTDLRKDVERLPGFIPYQKYANGGMQMLPGEVGSVGLIRFVLTTQATYLGAVPDEVDLYRENLNIKYTQGEVSGNTYSSGFGSSGVGPYHPYDTDARTETTGVGSKAVPAATDASNYGQISDSPYDADAAGGAPAASTVGPGSGKLLEFTNESDAQKIRVYPIVIFGQDAMGCVSLSGMDSVVPKVVSPQPAVTDPLGQTGSVGWKTHYACKVLNEKWLYRIMVGCSAI